MRSLVPMENHAASAQDAETASIEPNADMNAPASDGAPRSRSRRDRLTIRIADARDREVIYRMRHDVYARELGQHAVNEAGRLTDALDSFNSYIVVSQGDKIVGFVSVTPPGGPGYSIDKYIKREQLPFVCDNKVYEIRLLTVPQSARRTLLAGALMYAALRWIEAHGGTRIVAIGRHEILGMYTRVGLKPVGISVKSGAVTYDLVEATVDEVHAACRQFKKFLERIETGMAWQIGVAFRTPAGCFHGGEFFAAVGEEFDSLGRLETIVNADVLDAWFPPSPQVIGALQRYLPHLIKTSPPTGCEGMIRAIARTRGLKTECVLPGAGSSDLIFLALRHWLDEKSRVLILDPTYGEYAHILEKVIRCTVDRLPLRREDGYKVNLQKLEQSLSAGYDLIAIVNPNSPTGQHVPRETMEKLLKTAPPSTRIWVDETYVEYAGPGQSLETFAASSENVVVCKSMSKVYALSGVRAAYLCAGPHQLESLRAVSPPWAVSLPGQVAAVTALQDREYYQARYDETHVLRKQLIEDLKPLKWDIVSGVANFFLCHLPENGPDAATVVARCRERGVFLRNASSMGAHFGGRAVRIAVKDAETNRLMVQTIFDVLGVKR